MASPRPHFVARLRERRASQRSPGDRSGGGAGTTLGVWRSRRGVVAARHRINAFHRICLRRAVHRHVQSAEHKIRAKSRPAHQSRPPGARVARVRPPDDKGPRNRHIACRRDAPARAQVRRRQRFQSKPMRQNPRVDVTHASQDRGQRAARCSRAATCDAALGELLSEGAQIEGGVRVRVRPS